MFDPARQLLREMTSGDNRRTSIVLFTSAVCLTAWHLTGNYDFWLRQSSGSSVWMSLGSDPAIAAGIWLLATSVALLGIVPLLVVKLILRERLSDYGVQWGNLRFAVICCLVAAPVIVAISYFSAQSPAFQSVYPINPLARQSSAALLWHLAGQWFWYAAWEFHFRGFLQHTLEKSSGISTGIWVQTLASTLAHFGKPGSETFASILAGLLWGALAWRTRSLLSGIFQHWLLGACMDFFIFRGA
jgi:membrane protease YdiL (CAAX protease family)